MVEITQREKVGMFWKAHRKQIWKHAMIFFLRFISRGQFWVQYFRQYLKSMFFFDPLKNPGGSDIYLYYSTAKNKPGELFG